jgi:hypothetical protein
MDFRDETHKQEGHTLTSDAEPITFCSLLFSSPFNDSVQRLWDFLPNHRRHLSYIS